MWEHRERGPSEFCLFYRSSAKCGARAGRKPPSPSNFVRSLKIRSWVAVVVRDDGILPRVLAYGRADLARVGVSHAHADSTGAEGLVVAGSAARGHRILARGL